MTCDKIICRCQGDVVVKKDKPFDKSVYSSLALILQFGINMIVPIAMMTALGIYLDGRFKTCYLTIVLFFVGAIAGGQNIYRMAKRIYDAPDYTEKKETGNRNEADRSPERNQQNRT